MNFKFFLLFILIFSSLNVWANQKISLNCIGDKSKCSSLQDKLREIENFDNDIMKSLKIIFRSGRVKFPIIEKTKEGFLLSVKFKPTINKISLSLDKNIDFEVLKRSLDVNVGDNFDQKKIKSMRDVIKKFMSDQGYMKSRVNYRAINKDGNVEIVLDVLAGKPFLLKTLKISSKYNWMKNYFYSKLQEKLNKPFNFNNVKKELDLIKEDLVQYGYYLLTTEISFKKNGYNVDLDVQIFSDEMYVFDFSKNKILKERINKNIIQALFSKYRRSIDKEKIKSFILEKLKNHGYLSAKIQIRKREYLNNKQIRVVEHRINTNLGKRTKVRGIFFRGNFFFSEVNLNNLFNEHAFDLASRKYYDPDYHLFFMNKLKRTYIENGFIQVNITKPDYIFSEDKQTVDIIFNLKEGVRTYVEKINFHGVDESMKVELMEIFSNKLDGPFNPLSFENDISSSISFLKEKGFYKTKILNVNSDGIVKYSADFSSVELNINYFLGKKIILDNIYYVGLEETRRSVVQREISLEKGKIITPSEIQRISASLTGLGLFKTVKVQPLIDETQNSKTDVLVSVEERDYKVIEFIPGFRTDLGAKLETNFKWLNLRGKNQSVDLKLLANRRFSNSDFDGSRSDESKKLLEGTASLTFSTRYWLGSNIGYNGSLSFQRRRYYSFDADITSFNNTWTKSIFSNIDLSFKYLLEDISQFNVTDISDEGRFKVGSITPAIRFDYRNRPVNPSKGSLTSFSIEYASPAYGSDEDIKYLKFLTRNQFYAQLSQNWILALYVSLGYQKNLAGDSDPIPDIKVFRLAGIDNVRGYDFEEINTLLDGSQVSDVDLNNNVYMANFKLEPRYIINDSMVLGIFCDAGRIYTETPDLFDLRTSVGLSFKYLTPIGSLDFDYGIKTLRKTSSDGTLESPGRFHVSIGFF